MTLTLSESKPYVIFTTFQAALAQICIERNILDGVISTVCFKIDNGSYEDVTVIKFEVEISNDHAILREVIGLLSKINIVIINVSMLWEYGWRRPMEILHVTDSYGNKIIDEQVIDNIKEGVEAIRDGKSFIHCDVARESDRVAHFKPYCSIDLTGTDKRGLCKVRGDHAEALAGPDCEIDRVEICTYISQMFAIFRAISPVKQSSCQYLSLRPAQKTTTNFLFDTLFERPIPLNPKLIYQNDAGKKRTIMSSRIQKKVRIIRLPSVNGKGSKTSRIK